MKCFKAILIFFMGFLMINVVHCTDVCDAADSKITVKGIITNIKKAEAYFSPKMYMQLVRVPEDGNLKIMTDENARMAYESDLPKIPVPKNGKFTFVTEHLAPCKYIIVLQYFERATLSGDPQPSAILAKEGNWVNIDIAKNTKLPLVINLGDTYIRFP